MFVIAVVAVIVAAGLTVTLAVVLLVTVGVHQEERRLTFARLRGPTVAARGARLILGRYVRPIEPEPPAAGRVARQRGPTVTARAGRLILGRHVRPAEPKPPAAGPSGARPAAAGDPGIASTRSGCSAA